MRTAATESKWHALHENGTAVSVIADDNITHHARRTGRYRLGARMASFLSPLFDTPPPACALVDARSGAVIAAEILPAFDSATRNKGLLGRSSLDDRVAMILAPCMAVHTFFMQFPIDIAFVTRTGRVIKLRERVRPRRIAVALGAFAVIEMAAGAFSRSGSGAGSELIVRRQEPEPFVWRGAEVPLPSR